MIIDFAKLDLHDRPTLILKNAGDTPLGVVGHATKVSLEGNYNETSVLSFTVPAKVDGEPVPYYDDIVSMRILELPDIGQFTLVSPEQHNDGVSKYKDCKAYSLEYEFSYKKITLAKDTYKFWDDALSDRSSTVLGMIMELMPAWHVASVSASLMNKYRTFEVDNENLYNFIKNTIQQSYGCIFDFDTLHRAVTVRAVEEESGEQPVYLSTQNLVKELTIHEDVENLVTRLDMNGADGVDIRDVNPTGTNKIINLDYYMNDKNFPQALIDKYNAWKQLVQNQRETYYINSINHTLAIMKANTARAHLVDLEGELTDIDNQRGVIIQAISQGLQTQSALDSINTRFNLKASQVEAAESEIETLEEMKVDALQALADTVAACSFENYFTEAERSQLDRYIRDGEVTESSFVSSTQVYDDSGTSMELSSARLSISGSEINYIQKNGKEIYDIRGGTLTISGVLTAKIISAVLNASPAGDETYVSTGMDILFTASLGAGTLGNEDFPSGSITIDAPETVIYAMTSEQMTCTGMSGNMYFSLNPSEYQRRSVAWELYEYGEALSKKLSQPTYSFSVESANFLALEEFESFKNHLKLGDKIYLDNDGEILKPICIGFQCSYDDLSSLTLKFSDSYVQSDTSFKLADILEKSVSMGKTVDAGKFNYEEFTQSGARTSVRQFMSDALDVSRNKILSSRNQAISWDDAGLRLRKWANANQTAYENEQIWLNNNSVLMTDDNWRTAKMAIGKVCGDDGEQLWGLIAEMVVGKLIAGESLIIESEKRNGGVAVFRVDGDGCRIENGDLSVIGATESVWKYRTNSNTKMYLESSADSRVVRQLSANTVLMVQWMEVNDGDASGTWGYSQTLDGQYFGFVDLDGCTQIESGSVQNHIVIHPDVGIVMGMYPAASKNASGHYVLNTNNARMWIDSIGNIHLTGAITATSLHINGTDATDIVGTVHDLTVDNNTFKSTIQNELDTAVSEINQTINGVSTRVTNLNTAVNGVASRVSTAESKITPTAIINTVTTGGGKDAIESIIEQSADSIRLKADTITWEADNSSMDEDGTLTAKKAILDGNIAGVDGTTQNGIIIGRSRIMGLRSGSNVFNILLPILEEKGTYCDTEGTLHNEPEPAVSEVEFELGSETQNLIYPPADNSNYVDIGAVGSDTHLRIGTKGLASIIIDSSGRFFLYPRSGLFVNGRRGYNGTVGVGMSTFTITDGIITNVT